MTAATATPCTRYPCDHAYSKRAHWPSDNGQTLHVRSVGGGHDLVDFHVAAVALDDGPWRVAARLPGDDTWQVITDDGRYRGNAVMRAQNAIENAVEFANAVMTAAIAASGTWLHDGAESEFEQDAFFWGPRQPFQSAVVERGADTQ